VFVFVIAGKKKFLTWPYEVFADRGEEFSTLDYEAYLDQAIELEGEPGDIIYWPASYWHTGEASGALSLSVNLSLDMRYRPLADVLAMLEPLLEQQLGDGAVADLYGFNPEELQQTALALPEEMRAAAAGLEALAGSQELAQALRLGWLNRVTGYGFRRVPASLAQERLSDEAVIRADGGYPVVCMGWGEGQRAVSANGQAFVVRGGEVVEPLIERLNRGEAQSVASLIGQGEAAQREFLRQVLEKLLSLRAIQLCSDACSVGKAGD
jgi:hypothetical protein